MNNRLYLCVIAFAATLNFPMGIGEAGGSARGETSDEKGQQGLGLGGSGSSNVIMGGPEIIEGHITGIQGEQYSIQGDRGQNITLRVTKDTNKVCAKSQGTRFSTGQEGSNEHHEIAPTTSMRKQREGGEPNAQPQENSSKKEPGALSKDPSALQDVVGTTDSKAKEDVARGSGFVVGGAECHFKKGDQVRIEASDMGTATTIKQLSHGSGG